MILLCAFKWLLFLITNCLFFIKDFNFCVNAFINKNSFSSNGQTKI